MIKNEEKVISTPGNSNETTSLNDFVLEDGQGNQKSLEKSDSSNNSVNSKEEDDAEKQYRPDNNYETNLRRFDKIDTINEDENESVVDELEPPNKDQATDKTDKPEYTVNPDDEKYIIRNKDTGEVYDMREESHMNKVIHGVQGVKLKENPWQNYWKQKRKSNENMWDAVEDGDEKRVLTLLDAKLTQVPADVNSKLLDDWTALHLAANEGHCEVAKVLLRFGANIEAKTTIWRTPLHIACMRGLLRMVKLLVEASANINALDKDFSTPLHYVSEHGFNDILEYFLALPSKPDVTLKNHAGLTAYDLCLNIESRRIFEKNGIADDQNTTTFGRISVDDFIIFNSRTDFVGRILHGYNQSRSRTMTMNNNSAQKKKLENGNDDKAKSSDESKGQQANANSQKSPQPSPTKDSKNDASAKYNQVPIQTYNKQDTTEKLGPHSFTCHSMLGKGSFGEVYLVEKLSSQNLYAMKVLRKDRVVNQNLTRYAKTERNVLSIMNHPFIVRLHYAFQTDSKLYLVLEYAPGGDLGNMIAKKKRFSEDVARIYTCEILLALEALHKQHIIFRDLKPDNVVLDAEGHALLTDFGLSKEGMNTNISKSFCGSVAYLAPEMLQRSGHDRSVDWYLLGVMLYEMLVGIPPYFSSNREELFDNIQRAPLKLPKVLSEDAKSLITGLLKRDRTKRLGAKGDSEEIKAHPWFKSINWDDVYQRKLKPPIPDKRKSTSSTTSKINDKIPETTPKHYIEKWSFVNPNGT